MTGWQVQAMWETETAMLWEELNAPDPYEGKLIESAGSLQVAINHLDKALDWTVDAGETLTGTPMEAVVLSLADQIENLKYELADLRKKYGRGERE